MRRKTGHISGTPHNHIFRFQIENPVFSSAGKALKYYIRDGQQLPSVLGHLHFSEIGLARGPVNPLLEFASGYGCVTRHIAGSFSPVNIVACEIHREASDFIEFTFDTQAILSLFRPEDLSIENYSYDPVFALGFFAHDGIDLVKLAGMPIRQGEAWQVSDIHYPGTS